MNDARPKVKSE
ncbi:putative IS1648 transposase (plasmid) [Deinococcus gobiensis I-0]|uniref:Putative IS1648 transposase n=2 Tax=Deinococcus TaxID=1298 RepID=H8H1T6_DEIGI|nr:putative IS1648 transposase [Deinococcus gobiensis I-0]